MHSIMISIIKITISGCYENTIPFIASLLNAMNGKNWMICLADIRTQYWFAFYLSVFCIHLIVIIINEILNICLNNIKVNKFNKIIVKTISVFLKVC